MTASQRVKRERFLPFAFERHGLSVRVDSASLDGASLPLDEGDALHVDDEEWRELTLAGAVELRKGALGGLPGDERVRPGEVADLWLVVQCDRTAWRAGHRLELEGEGAKFELSLERDRLAGVVEVVPWLVRRRSEKVPPGYAGAAGARLATGARFAVYPHEPASRAGEFLEVVYVSFGADAVLSTQPWRLYHLETHGETPVLRINADHQDVVRVLDAKGQTGLEARLREVFYDLISRGGWSLLFMSAVEALDEDGNAPRRWQEGVLTELLPFLFPGAPKAERMDELLALRADEAHLSLLATQCDEALQQRLDLVKHINRLIDTARGSR